MPLDQDDILMGEKTHYYCSSSEDEPEPDPTDADPDNPNTRPQMTHGKMRDLFTKPDPEDDNPWSEKRKQAARMRKGKSGFTGPKGVIEDEKNFGKEAAAEEIRKRVDLQEMNRNELSAEEKFFEEYRKQRLKQLQAQYTQKNLESLAQDNNSSSATSSNFLSKDIQALISKYTDITLQEYLNLTDLTDKWQPQENINFTLFVHLYDEEEFMCDIIDDCFESINNRTQSLNSPSNSLIFVKIRAADMANLSEKLRSKGLPAVQIFRNDKMLFTTVKMEIVENIGEDFTCDDFMRFLRNGVGGDLF